MLLKSTALALLACIAPAAAVADPVGTFAVRGLNPDDSSEYTGKVRITRTGETYKVVWTINNEDLTGTGVGIKLIDGKIVMGAASEDDVGISIAYSSGDSFGTVVYFEQPDGSWHGIWAYNGWDHISTEDWLPKDRKPVTKVENDAGRQDQTVIKSLDRQQTITAPMPAQQGPKS